MNLLSKLLQREYLSIITSLVLIIFSILALVYVYDSGIENKLTGKLSINLILTLLVTASVGTVYNIFFKNSILDGVGIHVSKELNRGKGFSEVGLSEVHYEPSKYDFTNIIRNSEELCIIINDGKFWISSFHNELKSRLENKKMTKFVFLDLDNNNLNDVMLT